MPRSLRRFGAHCNQELDVIEDAMKAREFLVVNHVSSASDHFARLEAEHVHLFDASRERCQAVSHARRAVERGRGKVR